MNDASARIVAAIRGVADSIERGEIAAVLVLARASGDDAWGLAVLGVATEEEGAQVRAGIERMGMGFEEVTLQ